MELWFFYALVGAFFVGIQNYLIKLIADRKIDGSIITFFQGVIYLSFGFLESFFRGEDFSLLFAYHPAIFYSIGISFVIFSNLRFRVRALQYLSASEYYIGYRISLTLFLVLIGFFFLSEAISATQILSLALGSIAIYLLFEEDISLRGSRHWGRAIGLLFLSIVSGVGIQVLGKFQGTSHFPFSLLLLVQGVIMLIISGIFDRGVLSRFFRGGAVFSSLRVVISATICVYFGATYNLYAYEYGGNVSVVTKIMAYSLFIPIILGIFLGGERITYKKTIALLLTIVSLYYMV